MPIYEILVIDTNKFKVQVEAETPEQALERAEVLALTEDSWCEGTIEYCEDAICELKKIPSSTQRSGTRRRLEVYRLAIKQRSAATLKSSGFCACVPISLSPRLLE